MTAAPFVALGNVTIDDLVFADGSTMWCVPGGNSIYSALGMALWEDKPRIIAPIGPEYPAATLRDRIDLSRCRPIERNLRNWGLYEEDGTRVFTFRTKMQNWLDFCPTSADLGEGPYVNCHLAPLPWQLHIELAQALRARGARVISLDPDERNIHSLDRASLRQLLGKVDLFLPSRQEADAIFPGAGPLDALRLLRELAPELPVIVVKCGADGVLAHRAGSDSYVRVPAVATSVVDPTGAGDAFCGGVLVGLARTGDLVEALLHGAVSASFAVAATGPAGLIEATPELAGQRLDDLRSRVEVRAFPGATTPFQQPLRSSFQEA
ncbi:MAG: hypothetical protein JO366_12065 [Methylobacteriaceae bacterium]|nr:hypothetical protein [Methylobacteriaceae bacterium]